MGAQFTKTLIVDGVGGGADIVTNGDFSTDSDWTKGTGWSISSDHAIHGFNEDGGSLSQSPSTSLVNGNYYTIQYEVVSSTAVTGILFLQGSFGNQSISSKHGIHYYIFQCSDSNNSLCFYVNNQEGVTLDNVSVREPGVNDTYACMKTAVDALGSEGGVVIVESGKYHVEDIGEMKTVEIPDNCSVVGRGSVEVIVEADIPIFRNEGYENSPNSCIAISGFKIEINMPSGTYSSNIIDMKSCKNSVFQMLSISVKAGETSSTSAAVALQGFENASIHPCDGNIITECTISDFGYGIYLLGYDSSNPNSEKNIVNSNYITNSYMGCYLKDTMNCTISANIITGNSLDGIRLENSDMTIIVNNQLTGNTQRGIKLQTSRQCTIQGNICKNNSNGGIYIQGSVSYSCEHNTISGNTCIDNISAGGNPSGIELNAYSSQNIVCSNNCSNNTQYGVCSTGTDTQKNLINANICYNNNAGTISLSGTGNIKAVNLIS